MTKRRLGWFAAALAAFALAFACGGSQKTAPTPPANDGTMTGGTTYGDTGGGATGGGAYGGAAYAPAPTP